MGNFSEKSGKLRIFLDLDEVLVDFVGGCCGVFKADLATLERNWPPGLWDVCVPLGVSEEFFWERLSKEGARFWIDLRPLPWARELIDLVGSITDDWYIVSAPSRCSTSYDGKVRWIKNFFGPDFTRFVLNPHKEILAKPGTVLIDDRDRNVTEFILEGGSGILWPGHQNSLHEYKRDPLAYVRPKLLALKEKP